MPAKPTQERYTSVAIALHWLIAIALVVMIALGKNMHDADHRPIEWMFQLHKSIGITILVLLIARIIWRWRNPPPKLPDAMPTIEKRASHSVHIGLYALMLGLPITGWIMVSVSPFSFATVLYGIIGWPHLPGLPELAIETREAIYPRVENIHELMSWGLIGLFALHLAGAIKHEIGDEEGVLKRMVPRLFGQTHPPSAPSSGALAAFGSAFLVFAIIAGGPVLAQSLAGDSNQSVTQKGGDWLIDYEASEIRFSGTNSGSDFSGIFKDWSASIQFDPEMIEAGQATVAVKMASTDTGNSQYDTTLEATEWFNTSAFPTATVELTNFREAEQGLTADATLTLKSISITVPFAFDLVETNGVWTMTGTTSLSRKAMNIGQDSDAGADWVSGDINVAVTVKASPS